MMQQLGQTQTQCADSPPVLLPLMCSGFDPIAVWPGHRLGFNTNKNGGRVRAGNPASRLVPRGQGRPPGGRVDGACYSKTPGASAPRT